MDLSLILFTVGIASVLLILAYVFLFSSKSLPLLSRPKKVLIIGPADSGKTVLFHQLVHQKLIDTVTSMKESEDVCQIDGKSLILVDLPGHDRLWNLVETNLKEGPLAVIFVVDSVERQYGQSAQMLFDLLVSDCVQRAKTPLLVIANKSDILLADDLATVKERLTNELDIVKGTRQSMSAEGMSATETPKTLGLPEKPFAFNQLPIDVVFASTSGKTGEVKAVKEFLRGI